jgi:hypothetical protein
MPVTKGSIQAAVEELGQKDLHQIQVETAYAWASRACAAGLLFQKTKKLQYAMWASEFAHEAVEHAALCGNPNVLDEVRQAITLCCGSGCLP